MAEEKLTPSELEKRLSETETKLRIAKAEAESAELQAKMRPGFLGSANNLVSTVAALAASGGLIIGTINSIKLGTLEARTKVEEPSYRFAKEFLDNFTKSEEMTKRAVESGVMLQALNIVAQASSSGSGESQAEDRALLPLVVALLSKQPGALAAMDEKDLKHFERWIAISKVDGDDQTRVTAMRALMRLAEKAYQEKDIPRLEKCVVKMFELRELLSDDEANLATHAQGVATLEIVGKFIGEPDTKVTSLSNEKQWDLDKVRRWLGGLTEPLQELQKELKVAQSKPTAAGEDALQPKAMAQAAQYREALQLTNTALAAATKGELESIRVKPATAGKLSAPDIEAAKPKLEKLIPALLSSNGQEAQQARSNLALLGQYALKPLLAEVNKQRDNQDDVARVQLGVADTLSRMRQPIYLDEGDAKVVVGLLNSSDEKTAVAAADFLMDLWDGPSIRTAFVELQKTFKSDDDPATQGRSCYYAALVVATWARNLNETIHGPSASNPMRDVALIKAKEWEKALKNSPRKDDWARTLGMLAELIPKAERRQSNAAAPASTPVPSTGTPRPTAQ